MYPNYNFYGNNPNYHSNNWTFQNNFSYRNNYTPQASLASNQDESTQDEEYMKRWEQKIKNRSVTKPPKISMSISTVRNQLCDIVRIVRELKESESYLSDNIKELSDEQWTEAMENVKRNRALIDSNMVGINDCFLETFKKVLAKRTAKRLRLKRLKRERKREKIDRVRMREELSRKIDENLQNMKDDIIRIEQEEQNKLQTDTVLREVHRKKSDAKKCTAKLDALMRLRKARQNTAKGRGQAVNDTEATKFNESIEQLKSLWMDKLAAYEQEESEMRKKLKLDSESQQEIEKKSHDSVHGILGNWQGILFGESHVLPQVDFGDVARFVQVRRQWDQYICKEGTPLPVGWVTPKI